MVFNSINFIFIFLMMFLASYFLIDNKYKNIIIFVYSILFYFFGNYNNIFSFIVLLIFLCINILFIFLIKNYYKIFKKYNDIKKVNNLHNIDIVKNKIVFAIKTFAIIFNILFLILFKTNIFSGNFPIGISFYTFSILSFYFDLPKIKLQNLSYFKILLYITFFPKMLSGPIMRYEPFILQAENKKRKNEIFNGFTIFIIGLGIKCILSDNINYVINQINTFGYNSMSIFTAWIGVYSFSMKLYFDFFGFSLMAIGLARIIGFNLPANFNFPFSANSISEFWRKWHITLSDFFKDYIYIPLGGNCKNKNIIYQCRNIFVVWFISGLWHGFKINYFFWAMLNCLFIIFEKNFLFKFYKINKYIGKFFVLIFIPITFVIFSIEDITNLNVYLYKLIDISSINNFSDFEIIMKNYLRTIIICLLFMTKLPYIIYNKIKHNKILLSIILIIIFSLSIYMIYISEGDTFKYFAF